MSDPQPDPELAGAGLSATGKTADQFTPGEESPGTTYGAPGGTGAEERESTTADLGEDAGESADGDGDVDGS